ncbi:MAG: substrate-binding domain-containing protein [Erysipelotrichaceae bacterium]
MKEIIEFLLCYALIPFVSSIIGFLLATFDLGNFNIVVVPLVAALFYILFRKKLKNSFWITGIILLVLGITFSVMMFISSGNVEGVLMSYFSYLLIPFAPLLLMYSLMANNIQLYLIVFLTYIAMFAASAVINKIAVKKVLIVLAVILLGGCFDTYLYMNRPSVKYGGHGFKYMHGYSSTDFSDYTVYSDNSRLVELSEESELIIENEEDMPILDGAEACYPLYAAFARAVYKDIDLIEKEWIEKGENIWKNGKIVSFTNSINAFDRLIYGEKDDDRVDMFFGAKPSTSQLEEAKNMNVELDITPIAREAFVFFVTEDNPVDNLSSEDIKAIYHGDITNWKQLGGKDEEILAFQRPKNSGSQTMMEYFMGDVSLKEPQTYEVVGAMEGVITKVAQFNSEKGAMGYSFRYFVEELNQEKNVKLVSIDGVAPSIENIEKGSYPLVTNVCLITRKYETNPYVERMKEFILSEQGQSIVKETGYSRVN